MSQEPASDEESEHDPSKVNVPVSTILLNFGKTSDKNQKNAGISSADDYGGKNVDD